MIVYTYIILVSIYIYTYIHICTRIPCFGEPSCQWPKKTKRKRWSTSGLEECAGWQWSVGSPWRPYARRTWILFLNCGGPYILYTYMYYVHIQTLHICRYTLFTLFTLYTLHALYTLYTLYTLDTLHTLITYLIWITYIILRSLEVKLPTIWTDEKHSQEKAQAWRKSEGRR